jgi:hypothetical protein
MYVIFYLRSKLEYASVICRSITTTDANKLDRIHAHYSYANALEYLKPYTFRKRRYHLYVPFVIQVYRDFTFCPSLLEAAGLLVPTRHLKDFSTFNVVSSIKNRPFAHQVLMLSAGTLIYLK